MIKLQDRVLEYPLMTYEYLYNFNVHLQFIKFDEGKNTLWFLSKNETNFAEFYSVRQIFYRLLQCGWDDLSSENKKVFFEEFEFSKPFEVKKTEVLSNLLPTVEIVVPKSAFRAFLGNVMNKLGL